MRVVVLGFGARDQDATSRCIARALRARDPGVDVVSAADDAAIAEADLVVLAGTPWHDADAWRDGELFLGSPTTTASRAARTLLLAASGDVRSALFAIGVAPLRTAAARRTVAFLTSLAGFVSVRDEESARALRAAGFAGPITVTADPLFDVAPEAAVVPAARRRGVRVGVVPNGADDRDAVAALVAGVERFAARQAIELVLAPPSAGADDVVTRLRRDLRIAADDVHIVAPAEAEAAARWLASCDVVVTTRTAGMVLAAVAATPPIAVGGDPALASTARLLGCADLVVDPARGGSAALERALQQAVEARAAIAEQLAARVDVARHLLAAGYDALLAAAGSDADATTADDRRVAALEQVSARLRARLEQREESWRTLATFLGRDVETIAPVSTGSTQRSRDIDVLKGRAEAAEAELAAIKRTRGWRLLHRYGVFKHRYLLPAYRFLARGGRARGSHSAGGADEDDPVVVPPGRYDVLCLPIIDWDFRFQRPQQLMSRFAAAGHRVFYVAPSFAEPGAAPTVTEKAPNVYHVTLAAPARNVWTQALDDEALAALLESLNRLRVDHGLGATLTCIELPFWGPLARAARDRFAWPILYDCMDDHAGFSTFTGATAGEEERLFAGADLVVVSSPILEERARRHTERVRLVRNGCDYEHFAPAGDGRRPGPRPVVGFYGAIADWFDADLVAELAERRPDWDFVMVGSTDMGDVRRLASLPNVRLPGEQPYADIPRWLATFDVTLLPFKRTPLTEATNPVKAYEILASGKPLVSVPLPEMRALNGLVRLAATAEEFERAIVAALDPGDAAHVEERRAFARANTWEARHAEIAAVVPELFPRASTVIVTYDNLAANRACFESLFARTEWPNHEVIVVDNASTDGTRAYLERLAAERDGLVLIANDTNVGFAAACNQGLARATGAYLVLLNNDTVVTRGWLSALVRHLHAVPEIGLIGPVTNEIGNEAKIAVGYRSLDDLPSWAARYTRAHADHLRGMRMLAMFCVAMRRATFEEVGPLDERFAIGMFEDDDYSRRMQRNGYRVVTAHDAFVHHVGGASFKRLDEARYREIFDHNRQAYERKWGLWTPHQDDRALEPAERWRRELDRIVAGVAPERVVVFLRFRAAPPEVVRRCEDLAAALARHDLRVFLQDENAGGDPRDTLRPIAPNLWRYRGPAGILERLEQPIVWALPSNALDAFRWLQRTIVYDVGHDPTAFPLDRDVLQENHERMLREADVVVAASPAAADAIRPRRRDVACVPDVAAAPDAAATLIDLVRNRRRAAPVALRAPRHATRFAGQQMHRGFCNVCGEATAFYFEDPALFRESLTCGNCLTTSRYRSIARGILRAIADLTGVTAASLADLAAERSPRRVRVYDTQVSFYCERNAYPIPDLLAACDWIDVETSTVRPGTPLGASCGPRHTNQNLERLTFADAAFDLVITSDVMEHVRLDGRAHREIRRVLAPGGAYVFTVPHHRDPTATVRVAIDEPDDPARDRFVMEPEYHGDANSADDAALCYRTYGRDLDATLEALGFAVDYAKDDVPELGILDTELFYCRVVTAAHAAAAGRDPVDVAAPS